MEDAPRNRKFKICLLFGNLYTPELQGMGASEIYSIYAKFLPRFGHEIIWVSPAEKKHKSKIVQKDGFKIYTIPYILHSSAMMKLFNQLRYYFIEMNLLKKVYFKERFNLIQVRDDVISVLIAIPLKKKYNIPLIFQYSFPKGEYKEQNSGLLKTLHGVIEIYLLKYILNEVDLILPISECLKKDLIFMGIPESKIHILPTGVDIDLFSPIISGEWIQKKYNLESSTVLIYVGAITKVRRLDTIIQAFAKVKKEFSNLKLMMVGEGDDKNDLIELACKLGVKDDVTFTGLVSFYDIPKYIAAADIGLVPVPNLNIFRPSVSTKLREYYAMGKPIVANREIQDHFQSIEQSKGGILVEFQSESFKEGIVALLTHPEMMESMGRNGLNWVIMNETYEVTARRLERRFLSEISKIYPKKC